MKFMARNTLIEHLAICDVSEAPGALELRLELIEMVLNREVEIKFNVLAWLIVLILEFCICFSVMVLIAGGRTNSLKPLIEDNLITPSIVYDSQIKSFLPIICTFS